METIKIADNQQYSIYVSPRLNRAYLRIIGFWRNAAAVPDYLEDWKKALTFLQDRFTLLTDATEMKTHPADVKLLHEQAQRLVMARNISKIAELMNDDIAEMQLDVIAKVTKFPKKNFKNREEAEKWLNEPV